VVLLRTLFSNFSRFQGLDGAVHDHGGAPFLILFFGIFLDFTGREVCVPLCVALLHIFSKFFRNGVFKEEFTAGKPLCRKGSFQMYVRVW